MASSRPDRQARAFRIARQHSFVVRMLRLALPAVVVVTLVAFAVDVLFLKSRDFGPVSYDSLTITDGALVMEGPSLTGLDEENRAYTLSADQASQRIGQTDQIDLVGIDASLAVDESMNARVQSGQGMFNQAAETLYLFDGVDVSTDTGYRVQLADANVDLQAGLVVSVNPVTVNMLNGTLDATGIKVINRGELITFTGRVKMIMQIHGQEGQ